MQPHTARGPEEAAGRNFGVPGSELREIRGQPLRSPKSIIGDRRPPSPLDKIQPDHWLPEYTSDLLDLLHVLGRLIALEARQADLLERICTGKLRKADELREAGALADAEGEPTSQNGKTKSKS